MGACAAGYAQERWADEIGLHMPVWMWVVTAIVALVYYYVTISATVRARTLLKTASDNSVRIAVADDWASAISRARFGMYIAAIVMICLFLATQSDGWRGLWLPVLFGLLAWPLRILGRRQDRRYSRLFLGVDLSNDSQNVA